MYFIDKTFSGSSRLHLNYRLCVFQAEEFKHDHSDRALCPKNTLFKRRVNWIFANVLMNVWYIRVLILKFYKKKKILG